MARERMVTRTVQVTECKVMMANTETMQVTTMVCEIGGGITDPNALLKAVKKGYETPTEKCVAIINTTVKEILYGMPEAAFIKAAKVLPPRTKIDQ